MKTTKLMSLALTGLVLAGMGGQVASADVIVNSDGTDESIAKIGENNTKTEVEIIDNTDPTDPTDPIKPTDPTQTMLTLEKVPSLYHFESKLVNGEYEIATNLAEGVDPTIEGEPVTVFNDRVDRNWSVKAIVKGNELENKKTSDRFTVSSFSINGKDIVVGTDGIVAKAVAKEKRTGDNNTGYLKTPVDSVGIKFFDQGKLKVGDVLEGTIQYTLYNSMDAQ